MVKHSSTRFAALAALAIFTFMTAGCATKKYVAKVMSPLETRLGKNEAKTDANSTEIKSVDQRASEGISAAQSRADEASQAAAKANDAAQTAQTTAQKGVDQANAVDQKVENVDNFQMVKTQSVLFGLNKSNLSDDATQELNELAQSVKGMKHYVIQVQGYTDSTGPKEYNLELSKRRADAVVRYLTAEEGIPLVKISLLGYGEDGATSPNNTREGRKENRRVDIKVLAPSWAAGQAQAQMQNTTPNAVTETANK